MKQEEVTVFVDRNGMTPRERNLADIGEIAYKYGFTVEDMLGPRRFKKMVAVRRECIGMLRAKGYSTTEIGRIMNRDHSSIVTSLQTLAAENG
jgi:chromosomal replication initiation ATPase DnaA